MIEHKPEADSVSENEFDFPGVILKWKIDPELPELRVRINFLFSSM
jgi:hypothetical protein